MNLNNKNMDKQSMLMGGKNYVDNVNFYQVKCKKHEYVWVTMTTTVSGIGDTKEIKKGGWLQCKHCGSTTQNQWL